MQRRRWGGFALLSLLTLCGASQPLSAVEVTGKLRLVGTNGEELQLAEIAEAVVFFRPEAGAKVQAPRRPVSLVTKNKDFAPRVLTIPVGATVIFPNEDPILHNVFSVSPRNRFDLGLYSRGQGKTHTFDSPGLVRVYCNVHPDMAAYLLVLDTPHHVQPNPDGSFRLEGLPPGPGTLTIWQERSRPWSQRLVIPQRGALQPLKVNMTVDRPRIQPHLNKFGKPYGRGERYR